jgi:hypothetical protein
MEGTGMTQREQAQAIISELFELLEGESGGARHIQDLHADLESVLDRSQNSPPHGESDGSINERRWNMLRQLHWSCQSIIKDIQAAKEDF